MDKKSLAMLVCPISRTALKYDEKNHELISEKAKLAFPISAGVPIMLVEQARKLD